MNLRGGGTAVTELERMAVSPPREPLFPHSLRHHELATVRAQWKRRAGEKPTELALLSDHRALSTLA